MKNIALYVMMAIFLGCTNKQIQKDFSYQEALAELQKDINTLPDGEIKNCLTWKLDKILKKDTMYKYYLWPESYDSMKYTLIWNDYLKHPLRQMNLDHLDLIAPADRIEAYKFIYTRSFLDDVVIITIFRQSSGRPTIKWQVYSAEQACNPIVGGKEADGSCFQIKLNEAKHITESEWQKFKELLAKTKYWTLPNIIDNAGLDGSGWQVHGTRTIQNSVDTKTQEYRDVYRWSAEPGTPIYTIGKYLMDSHNFDWGEIY